jgi:hypothetical protein
MEIRFEDLVLEMEPTLRKICGYLELDFHRDMIRYHENSSNRLMEHLGRHYADGSLLISQVDRQKQQASSRLPPQPAKIGVWQTMLKAEEKDRFEKTAGATLRQFGYSPWNGMR